jgi:hypothetical protein
MKSSMEVIFVARHCISGRPVPVDELFDLNVHSHLQLQCLMERAGV